MLTNDDTAALREAHGAWCLDEDDDETFEQYVLRTRRSLYRRIGRDASVFARISHEDEEEKESPAAWNEYIRKWLTTAR